MTYELPARGNLDCYEEMMRDLNPEQDPDFGIDVINPGDYFVDGHPIHGFAKPKRETKPAAKQIRLGNDGDKILRKHRAEDWPRQLTEKKVDRATKLIRAGRRKLEPKLYEALVRFTFADFPPQRRAALRAGQFKLADGTNVIRGEIAAVAA